MAAPRQRVLRPQAGRRLTVRCKSVRQDGPCNLLLRARPQVLEAQAELLLPLAAAMFRILPLAAALPVRRAQPVRQAQPVCLRWIDQQQPAAKAITLRRACKVISIRGLSTVD